MASKALPCPTVLRQLLRYDPDTGKLFWRERPSEMFFDLRAAKIWNTRSSGKEAFTAGDGMGYRAGSIFGVKYVAHRVAWALHFGAWPEGQIDHINGGKADNRISNLRDVTQAENGRNQRCPSTNRSGVIGVCWHKSAGKWMAHIRADSHNRHLGYFDDIDAAIAARRAAEICYGYHENHGRRSSH